MFAFIEVEKQTSCHHNSEVSVLREHYFCVFIFIHFNTRCFPKILKITYQVTYVHDFYPFMHKYIHTHNTSLYVTSPPRADPIFLLSSLESVDRQYLNGQYLACELQTGMYAILTKSGLSFMYKMIQEIISMSRVNSGYPHNFWSFPGFSRMISSKLKPKPTADIECVPSWLEVCSWHVQNMHNVHS